MYLSIVSPVYRAEKIVEQLVEEIHLSVKTITDDYEIILVEDGSPDDSWGRIEAICKRDTKVRGLKLSRNFGQHPAITAGLAQAIGEWIVVMDCDLQDQPKEIIKLYKKANEGYDIVLASRHHRQDNYYKKLSSRIFYKVFNYFAGIEINSSIANFGIYKKKVITSVLNINDSIKFFPLFINWVGYKSVAIDIEHKEREEGKSSYSFGKLVTLAFNAIISFSDKPLRIFIGFGATISLLSIIVGIYMLIMYFSGKITEPGFASIIISIWFLSGIIISCIGIVGVYLAKTFNQVKNRPIFIIDKVLN